MKLRSPNAPKRYVRGCPRDMLLHRALADAERSRNLAVLHTIQAVHQEYLACPPGQALYTASNARKPLPHLGMFVRQRTGIADLEGGGVQCGRTRRMPRSARIVARLVSRRPD